jgi:hypothetical protein
MSISTALVISALLAFAIWVLVLMLNYRERFQRLVVTRWRCTACGVVMDYEADPFANHNVVCGMPHRGAACPMEPLS